MALPASLAGKVALVVGGSGGIGRASARMLAEAGARCIVTHRAGADKAAAASALAAALPGEGHFACPADVGDTGSILALRDRVLAEAGRLDILVNAAGFTRSVPNGDLDALDDDLIDRMFAVNWRGQFAVARAFAPALKASGDGLIVFVSSIAGTTGAGSNLAYCAVKAGIDVLTRSLAKVLAPEIRVLAVSPGVVDTEFVPGRGPEASARIAATIPLRRIAGVDDVAAAIAACATHLVYSTGASIVVDGGRSL